MKRQYRIPEGLPVSIFLIHIHTHTHACIYTHTRTHIGIYVYVLTHMCIYTHTYTYRYICMCFKNINTYMFTWIICILSTVRETDGCLNKSEKSNYPLNYSKKELGSV